MATKKTKKKTASRPAKKTKKVLKKKPSKQIPSMRRDVPDKSFRPRAYEHDDQRYQWYFRGIPAQVLRKGHIENNPFRARAFYVVHGIGDQALSETAARIRWEIEETIPEIEPSNWQSKAPDNWMVAEPFVYDGFWGDYTDMESMAPEVCAPLTQKERDFLGLVWRRRAVSGVRSLTWLTRTGIGLIRRAKGITKLYYMGLVPLLLSTGFLMLFIPRYRKILNDYVNDARLYLDPRGDVELDIVQRIDRRVGERFLRMLGLDWDFNCLDKEKQLKIAQNPHVFDEVLWIAHSLGTVISYNVISDLLHRCLEMRKKGEAKLEAVERVERGLLGFVTLGSPLDKVAYLFGEGVIRKWPDYYVTESQNLWSKAITRGQSSFWYNYHYTSDPVSGHLDAFPNIENIHPEGWRLPGIAHSFYWKDRQVHQLMMRTTFREFVLPLVPKTRPRWLQKII